MFNKKFIFSLLLFFTLIFSLKGQTFIEGVIIDAQTNEPLDKVNIFNQTSNLGAYSELDGTFKVPVNEFPSVIIFSYVGFENYLLELKEAPTTTLTIRLEQSSFGLPEIAVTDELYIESLTEDKFTVKDFLIDARTNNILILTYASLKLGNALILQSWEGEILHRLQLEKERVESLEQSCLGNIHMLGKKNAFEIALIGNTIQLISKYRRKQFDKLLAPCIGSSKTYIYNQHFSLNDQLVTYLVVNKKNQNIKARIKVVDALNLSRKKDDFVLQGQFPSLPITWAQRESWNQLMYKPLYSPLLNMGNELCLFNHTLGYLEFLEFNGDNKRFTPISYHKNDNWVKQVMLDKKHNNAFTVFNTKKGKSIHQINLVDGTTQPVLFFNSTFVEKMEIHNGYLLYLESGVTNKERNRILQRVKLDVL